MLQHKLVRSLKLRDFFQERDRDNDGNSMSTFIKPSTWVPPDHRLSDETLDTIGTIERSTEIALTNYRIADNKILFKYKGNHNSHQNNLTQEERRALSDLCGDSRVIIKPADKGSCTVIMDTMAYIGEADRQLQNTTYYKKIPAPIYRDTVPLLNNVLLDMQCDGFITHKQYDFLRASIHDRPRQFYILPKIHKPHDKWPSPKMPEGRPIISDTGSESYRVAQFINSYIRPISMSHPAFIKDTYDFVSKIRGKNITPGAFLVTGDVTALYTNMRFQRTMEVVARTLSLLPSPRRPDNYLLKLLELTMTRNDFEFNGNYYLQTCGMAMGKTYAPALADLYMIEIDNKVKEYHIPVDTYFRFLDDLFFIWEGSEENLLSFRNYLNSIIPGISITLNWSRESINFLDTTVYRFTGLDHLDTLRTKVYFKDTDTHQLLHKKSFHQRHTCRGVLKSQLIRLKRISSTKEDYDDTCHILFHALSKRHYSKSFMRKLKRDIWATPQHINILPGGDQDRILPIVVPFNRLGTELCRSWRTAITENPIFRTSRLITAYTVGKNLRHFLVRSKLNNNTNSRMSALTMPGQCTKCGDPKCKTCPLLLTGPTFSGSIDPRTFKVKGQITCKTKNLIYLITCRACRQQYVGETGRKLCERVCDHRSAILLRKNTPVARHFNLPNHNMGHFQIMGIHALPNHIDAHARKTHESNYQYLLNTFFPHGINNS